MLKEQILQAVESVKQTLLSQRLLVEAQLVVRGQPVHVPGSAPVHPENLHDIKIAIVSYKTKEIDGERIKASDRAGLIFPETGKPVPKPNDVVRSTLGDLRVIYNDKVMIGDEVALSQVHLRAT